MTARTDSRFLTEDMEHSLPDLVKLAFHTFPVEDVDNVPVHAEQVVNNKKVTDHHAIIPTKELQKCNLSELPKGELAILQLISNRLCVAVGDGKLWFRKMIRQNPTKTCKHSLLFPSATK